VQKWRKRSTASVSIKAVASWRSCKLMQCMEPVDIAFLPCHLITTPVPFSRHLRNFHTSCCDALPPASCHICWHLVTFHQHLVTFLPHQLITVASCRDMCALLHLRGPVAATCHACAHPTMHVCTPCPCHASTHLVTFAACQVVLCTWVPVSAHRHLATFAACQLP